MGTLESLIQVSRADAMGIGVMSHFISASITGSHGCRMFPVSLSTPLRSPTRNSEQDRSKEQEYQPSFHVLTSLVMKGFDSPEKFIPLNQRV
jgi:hypothetical protein